MKEAEEDADTQELRSALAASDLPEDRQEMLFNLGLFHMRNPSMKTVPASRWIFRLR